MNLLATKVKFTYMKKTLGLLLVLSLIMIGCSTENSKPSEGDHANRLLKVPEKTVLKSSLRYDHKQSRWLLGDVPFSGFAISYYPDGSLMEKFGILNGRKQNVAIKYYPDGHFKNVSNYHEGKLDGEKKVWTSDAAHVLIAHYQFRKGRAHGEQKKWYATGELFKVLHLKMGREEGIQKAFRENGALYANYEAREGRIFGLKKAALCYGLEEEQIGLGKQ